MKHTDLKHFIISIACIFVSSIIFIGLFFHDNKYTHAGLQPANGILYLSESELSSHSLRFLIRGWCFYPDRLLTPDDLPDNSDYMTYTAIGEHTHFDLDGRRSNPHGQGTYVLRIILPEKEASYSLCFRKFILPTGCMSMILLPYRWEILPLIPILPKRRNAPVLLRQAAL